MRYIYFNPNPEHKSVGDCVIRSICKIINTNWEEVFDLICDKARSMHDMPSSNAVWSSVLKDLGFKRYSIPNSCPDCYTIQDFCLDHPHGSYILATGTHAVAVYNGNYYDSWDSGNEIPIYYFKEE
jgi:hypothetical protein